ncbi:hypothetical protein H6G00_01305 [Leptolyngbya sp. FACHB-541]|uniref:hypothetical protein n=1 Tax=Leptolyngbya sp. FACHB-541 TaxID=2692810 RepID=UPI0016886AF5|nr:hypothetical protein [Leptolyngbya sp. FACHB-541]MBD1995267.1 hypothetical protein [Leptolyngbya sp. FACHB-541]
MTTFEQVLSQYGISLDRIVTVAEGRGRGSVGQSIAVQLDNPIGNRSVITATCFTPCPPPRVKVFQTDEGQWYAVGINTAIPSQSQVVQNRRRRGEDTTTVRIAVLYSITLGDVVQFWLGGDRLPIKIYEIPRCGHDFEVSDSASFSGTANMPEPLRQTKPLEGEHYQGVELYGRSFSASSSITATAQGETHTFGEFQGRADVGMSITSVEYLNGVVIGNQSFFRKTNVPPRAFSNDPFIVTWRSGETFTGEPFPSVTRDLDPNPRFNRAERFSPVFYLSKFLLPSDRPTIRFTSFPVWWMLAYTTNFFSDTSRGARPVSGRGSVSVSIQGREILFYRAYISTHRDTTFVTIAYDIQASGFQNLVMLSINRSNQITELSEPSRNDWRRSLASKSLRVPSSGDPCIDRYRIDPAVNLYNGYLFARKEYDPRLPFFRDTSYGGYPGMETGNNIAQPISKWRYGGAGNQCEVSNPSVLTIPLKAMPAFVYEVPFNFETYPQVIMSAAIQY